MAFVSREEAVLFPPALLTNDSGFPTTEFSFKVKLYVLLSLAAALEQRNPFLFLRTLAALLSANMLAVKADWKEDTPRGTQLLLIVRNQRKSVSSRLQTS